VAAGEAEDRQRAMQRTVDEMQVSLSEREAEIIRLNLCLGDEKKKNNDFFSNLDMRITTSNNTPKRLSRSGSRH
jgi:uncharacterized protein YaaN involved in tellurite resistance